MSNMPTYMQSLRKESVLQSVINRITDAIKTGELKPGDRLPPEMELAESLGVARSSVREAIKILAHLGVLESLRAEGTFVCNGFKESMIDPMVYGIYLNQNSFENIMELREMTESGMMLLAIEHHDERELNELEELLTEMQEVVKSAKDPINAFFDVDDRFHDKIAEMGKNPMADKINRVVRSLTYDVRMKTCRTMIENGRAEELIDAHRLLLDAIRGKNLENLSEKVRNSYHEEAIEDGQ